MTALKLHMTTLKLQWTQVSNNIAFTDFYVVAIHDPVAHTYTPVLTVYAPDTYTIDASGNLKLDPFPFPTITATAGELLAVRGHNQEGGYGPWSNDVEVVAPPALVILSGKNNESEQTDYGFGLTTAYEAFPPGTIPEEDNPNAPGFGTLVSPGPFPTVVMFKTYVGPSYTNAFTSLCILGASGPPPQDLFNTLSYTDRYGNPISLNTADLVSYVPEGGQGQGFFQAGNYSLWTWEGPLHYVGSLNYPFDYTVTFT